MRVDAAQLFQRVLVGGVAARLEAPRLRQADLLEEDLRELHRRADVELVADGGVDLLLEAADLARQRLRHLVQRAGVDGDAVQLHPREDGDERHLDLVEELRHLLLAELRLEDGAQPGDRVGAGAGAAGPTASTSTWSIVICSAFLPPFAEQRSAVLAARRRSAARTSHGSARLPSSGRPAPPPSPSRKAAIIVSNSTPRTSMPWLARTTMSNLQLWPVICDLRRHSMTAPASPGRRRSAAAPSSPSAGVADRHVVRLAGAEREREADDVRAHRLAARASRGRARTASAS